MATTVFVEELQAYGRAKLVDVIEKTVLVPDGDDAREHASREADRVVELLGNHIAHETKRARLDTEVEARRLLDALRAFGEKHGAAPPIGPMMHATRWLLEGPCRDVARLDARAAMLRPITGREIKKITDAKIEVVHLSRSEVDAMLSRGELPENETLERVEVEGDALTGSRTLVRRADAKQIAAMLSEQRRWSASDSDVRTPSPRLVLLRCVDQYLAWKVDPAKTGKARMSHYKRSLGPNTDDVDRGSRTGWSVENTRGMVAPMFPESFLQLSAEDLSYMSLALRLEADEREPAKGIVGEVEREVLNFKSLIRDHRTVTVLDR